MFIYVSSERRSVLDRDLDATFSLSIRFGFSILWLTEREFLPERDHHKKANEDQKFAQEHAARLPEAKKDIRCGQRAGPQPNDIGQCCR